MAYSFLKKGSALGLLLVNFTMLLLAGCYIDESIDVGEGYGFNIGDTKQEAFIKAREVFNEKAVYILYPIDKRGYGPHKQLEFGNDDFNLLEKSNTWKFYFDSGYRDSLTLNFSKGELANIRRHKQSFEIP